MSQLKYDDEQTTRYGSKSPTTAFAARVVTLASLIVSIAVLKTNDANLDYGAKATYTDFRSYKYMFYVMVIGVVYSIVQIPFAVYYMKRKKHLVNSVVFLKFDFFGDKVLVFLLATGVGAGFGMTMDMKKYWIRGEEQSKMQDFFTMAYIPAAFLLVGCFTSGLSSIYSSLALS